MARKEVSLPGISPVFFLFFMISLVEPAPKSLQLQHPQPELNNVRVAYSISELSKPSRRSLKLPLAESTLPHAPVLREMNDSGQRDMSTSTPSSESLESQLQSPHIVRKKALVEDFDTSAQMDELLHLVEGV